MIQVKNVSKKYGNHYAVKNLSFSIEKGKVYGFLGPNGAGKSTTMNIMTGYIASSDGEVTINGHDIVKDAEAAKKCIGYLPEIPPLYQDMTVIEYLSFVAELKKVPKNERKSQINDVMEKAFISDMSQRLIKNLSKGYKQRVGLAQAMLGNPEIIILDEPTVGLDPKQIIEIRELIRELKKEHTVILSSHILSEVAEVCDQLMIIAKGRLVASGTEESLLEELGQNNTIEITVKGDYALAEKTIKNIDGVIAVESEVLSDNQTNFVVKFENGVEIRDELCQKLADNKLTIYRLVLNSKSLEDLFLELTDDAYVASLEKEENDEKNEVDNSDASDNATDDKKGESTEALVETDVDNKAEVDEELTENDVENKKEEE